MRENRILLSINFLKELIKEKELITKEFIAIELFDLEKINLCNLEKEEVAFVVKNVFPEAKEIPSPPHEVNWWINGRLLVATNEGQDSWKFDWDWTSRGL